MELANYVTTGGSWGKTLTVLLSGVRERDLDLLLAAHLTASEAFRTFVLRSTWAGVPPHVFLGCQISVVTDAGETDLLLLVRLGGHGDGAGQRLALMLETKINAAFQPEQAARYHQRGEQGIRSGEWDTYRTCLVAPAAYVATTVEGDGWNGRLKLQDVAAWARRARGPYEAFLAQVCDEAVAKQARAAAGASPEATAFWQAYREAAGKLLPELEITRLSAPVSQAAPWPRFGATSLPVGVLLEHKPSQGRVDLTVVNQSADRLRAATQGWLPLGIQVVTAGQSAALRLAVPRVDHLRSFAEQETEVLAVLAAVERLHALGRSLPRDALLLSGPHNEASAAIPEPNSSSLSSGTRMHGAMLEGLARYARLFEVPDFQFATWRQPASGASDPHASPVCDYSDEAVSFIRAVYDLGWARKELNWSNWMSTPEAKWLTASPDHIAEASFDQLGKLLTALIRGDRFIEGNLKAAFDAGLLTAIVRRAETILSASPG